MAGEMDQLGVRERRNCLFKKELRGLESLVLASWRSHQWGSTEPTETAKTTGHPFVSQARHTNGALRSRLKRPLSRKKRNFGVGSHQWGSTEPTETPSVCKLRRSLHGHTNGALRSRLKLSVIATCSWWFSHTNGALRSRLKLEMDRVKLGLFGSHQWGSTEPTETCIALFDAWPAECSHTNGALRSRLKPA